VEVVAATLAMVPVIKVPGAEEAAPPFTKWAKKAAIRIRSTDPNHDLADLEPLKRMIGDARIVAIGESRHDIHEQFQLKHRIVELLVQQMNFTAVAMEVSMPDATRINDYVVRGVGDPEKLVHDSLGYWDAWDTEEILVLVRSIRRYNVNTAHRSKVRFYGFDMMFPASAVKEALSFLEQVNAERATIFREQTVRVREAAERLSREEWTTLSAVLSELTRDLADIGPSTFRVLHKMHMSGLFNRPSLGPRQPAGGWPGRTAIYSRARMCVKRAWLRTSSRKDTAGGRRAPRSETRWYRWGNTSIVRWGVR